MCRWRRSSERRALGAPATRESKGAFLWQLGFILYICGEEVAAIPWAAKARKCAAYAVCRSTQRLRPIHDRGKGAFAVFGSVPLLADIDVPGDGLGSGIVCWRGRGSKMLTSSLR